MSELSFDVGGWISVGYGAEEVRATTGALKISAGEGLHIALTEVEDRLGQTVRPYVHVPLVSVAEWLLMNWWRLRWEGRPAEPTSAWRSVHCLSGIGGDHAWPNLELSSDGAFIHLEMEAEPKPDVSGLRYLRSLALDVPARDFEAAVERLVDVVESRLASTVPDYRRLSELRAELNEERNRPHLAKHCRWQALAGIDPGEASDAWLQRAETLVEDAGASAGEEIMTVVPELERGLESAAGAIERMKSSTTTVDLSWVPKASASPDELPWQAGARLARDLRTRAHLGTGPLSDEKLSELLSVALPLQGEISKKDEALGGGYRNGVSNGRTKIALSSHRLTNQRFFLSRLIGAACVLGPEQHLVPVTRSYTALQKLQRSFAQELLCPLAALDAFIHEHGRGDEALADAAEYFNVSDWLVRSTLVNKGRLPRNRLPQAD